MTIYFYPAIAAVFLALTLPLDWWRCMNAGMCLYFTLLCIQEITQLKRDR